MKRKKEQAENAAKNLPETQKKKSFTLLVFAALMLAASTIYVIYAFNTSYKEVLLLDEKISSVQNLIAGYESNVPEELTTMLADLKASKLPLQKPYSYGLTALFFSFILLLKGLHNAIKGVAIKKTDIRKLAVGGLMAALCYIGFAFLKIDIPVGPEKTAFHFGNVFCVLAALLLGGYWGGMAGAIGMTIGDLTTAYVTSAPKTFLLKLLIGLIVGFFAHKVFKISEEHSSTYITTTTVISVVLGMGFNVVADPVVGYFYKQYLLGVPQSIASALAKMSAITTFVNAVVCVIAASIFYLALRPALKKSGLFIQVSEPSNSPEAEKEATTEA